MSILQQQQPTPSAEKQILQIKRGVAQTAEQMFHAWNQSFDALWSERNGVSVAEKLEALGTDGAELFTLNTNMVTFMITNLTGKRDDIVAIINQKVSSLPAFTVNPDGTITLD